MHELGVLIEIVKQVEQIAVTNEVDRIESLVLQIGELSSMVPDYMKKLYPAAIEGTVLEDSTLEIEVIPANGLCKDCKKVFNLVNEKGTCPICKSKNFELLSGKEFMIKQITCC
ncbi:MAG: hydrogenase nickel incorporation protein HypA [Herbinix sp.]|jgi:hydrogenase nickel incorporation protein HypA/HybF|nr:hydrogenase nickel incorporation protein HypA [Herbinix sp.]